VLWITSRISVCMPTTIDTVPSTAFNGKVELIPRAVKLTVIRRSGHTLSKGQSNTTVLTLTSFMYFIARSVSGSSEFLIGQKESMVPIPTQTEFPAPWEANDIPLSLSPKALTCTAS